ncbi:MAG: lipocalin-like domain-containing protein, partial [Candidatus Nanopelagicales bacterium]|nr:lipocalin-like domain-containing protein [Candidatus Nanopelagicales bacterium]
GSSLPNDETPTSTRAAALAAVAEFDEATRDSIAQALWQREFDAERLPDQILSGLADAKHSPAAHGDRMRRYLRYLLDHPLSHTPDRNKVYDRLLKYCDRMSPQQSYVFQTNLLGPASTVGYDMIPARADLEFPRDHLPKLRSQVGWHFFVGSCWDVDGQEYGVELMFFQTALFPPAFAAGLGLSDDENQIVELQLAISEAGGRHFQAEPVTLSGTSGLVSYTADPFVYRLGRNTIQCHDADGFFPVTVKAWGVDRGVDPGLELGLDITFTTGKETLLQGADGCMPSVDGIGSLYYSIPNLQLDPSCSTLLLNGKTIKLASGACWFDHQWGYLTGAPRSSVMRAATYSSDPKPSGWDWFMAQLIDDRQITVFATHDKPYEQFYEQTGPNPPGTMKVPVSGTFMAADKSTQIVRGTLEIADWIKADHSPNPARYLVTNTWYPNSWQFTFDESVPADIREFSMTPIVEVAQSGYFANGAQYAEGAVVVRASDGTDLGRGFAESVSCADTRRTVHRLAGLPESDAHIESMSMRRTPKALALFNAGYVATHSADLEEIIKESAGLEFFSGPPTGQ